MSTKISAAGAMTLLSEQLGDSAIPCRQVRLQTLHDGKTLVMVDIDQRKGGTARTVCYEITPAEVIAAIRAHGVELSPASDEAIAAVGAMQRTSPVGSSSVGNSSLSSDSLGSGALVIEAIGTGAPAKSGLGPASFAEASAVGA